MGLLLAVIFALFRFTSIAFLWYNVIGCLVVIATGLVVSRFKRVVVAGEAA